MLQNYRHLADSQLFFASWFSILAVFNAIEELTPLADSRDLALKNWLESFFSQSNIVLEPLSGDAGFRRYFRFQDGAKSYIAVDSPPDKINNSAFVNLAQAFKQQKLSTPEIVASDLAQGFFCLQDFGEKLLGAVLTPETVETYYRKAFALLPAVAKTNAAPNYRLPDYDFTLLTTELNIFTEWLVEFHLKLNISASQRQVLNHSFAFLIEQALAQPKVTVHRDFHCRNLMLLADESIGIIDFQDAVSGPITYDIVSLLRDCYVAWPEDVVYRLAEEYRQLLVAKKLLPAGCDDEFIKWFDFMGIQRHVKASGIFARLWHRDGKAGYLKDIPLTLNYIVKVGSKYPQTRQLADYVKSVVLPRLEQINLDANQ